MVEEQRDMRVPSELVPYCPKCGKPVSAAASNGAAEAGTAGYTVTFTRENQWFAINPAVKIVVDERDEYHIDNGQSIRVPMAAGTHSVVFKCGIRNKVIDLTVQRDLELHLKWNRITGSLNVIGLIVAVLIIAAFIWLLFRPYKEATTLRTKVRV